eukprot:8889470-Pyramimonas_sp.AAC.1
MMKHTFGTPWRAVVSMGATPRLSGPASTPKTKTHKEFLSASAPMQRPSQLRQPADANSFLALLCVSWA